MTEAWSNGSVAGIERPSARSTTGMRPPSSRRGSGQWTPGLSPVLGFFHFRPGPRLAPLRGGFVRMQEGAAFPLHRHRDRELTLVLEGQMVDGDGVRYEPGDALDMPQGSTHTLRVAEGGPVMLALLHGAIEMLGQ